MANYRAIVHYNFKKGMEEQGIKFLENELIKKAQNFGCHYIEILQNDRDHSSFLGFAVWNDIEDARRFQSLWRNKEKELMRYCTDSPTRGFYKMRTHFMERGKKAA